MINTILKKYFLILSFILFQGCLFGQEFKDGFIVTNQLDTLACKVAKNITTNIRLSCKLDGAAEISTYTSADIQGYGYTESRFFQSNVVRGAFVEVIIEGGINLYHLNERYYVQKGEGKLYPLTEKTDTIQEGTKTIIKIIQPWKGVLNKLMSDCRDRDTVQTTITRLAERSLVRLLNKYHNCANVEYLDYKRQLPWTQFELGGLIGAQNATLRPSVSNPSFEYLDNTYQSFTGQVGLVVNWSSPRILRKWSLHTGAIYAQNRFHSSNVVPKPVKDEYYDLNIFLQTVSIPLLIQFESGTRPWSWVGQFGFWMDKHLTLESEVIQETVNDNIVETSIYEGFRSDFFKVGYAFSVGVVRTFPSFRASLLVRYRDLPLLSDEIEVDVEGSRFSLNLIIFAK